MPSTKTIKIGRRTIELVGHAIESPKAGKHRYESGRDADGNWYLKGKTGRWSAAYLTKAKAIYLYEKYCAASDSPDNR